MKERTNRQSQEEGGGFRTAPQTSFSTTVLVVGGGVAARTATRELTGRGHRVVLLDPVGALTSGDERSFDPEDGVTVWARANLIDFGGFPGNFRVTARMDGGTCMGAEVGAVLVAADCRPSPPFAAWGLVPSERVLSLSRLEEVLAAAGPSEAGREEKPRTYLLICGFTHPSHPLSQKRAMGAALQLAEKDNNRVIFLLEHFKVADPGLERLSRRARDAGVLFAKLTDTYPEITQSGGRIRVSYDDEALGEKVFMHPDRLVLEEAYAPAPYGAQLAALLGIHTDSQGFFQGDNVADRPIFTNRTGIWVAGQSKGPVSETQCVVEACAAAHEAACLLDLRGAAIPEDRIVLNTRKCTICLTCYRLCPHRAISYVHRRPIFSSLACRSCGICVAECPMHAIQLSGVGHEGTDVLPQGSVAPMSNTGVGGGGRIVAFCCGNSAYESARSARLMGAVLPEGLDMVRVPCAGSVKPADLLNAFRSGAAGVMVLGCHHDSCRSVNGSRLAGQRVRVVGRMIEEAGVSPERLFFGTLAPATPMDFAAALMEMERRLEAMNKK